MPGRSSETAGPSRAASARGPSSVPSSRRTATGTAPRPAPPPRSAEGPPGWPSPTAAEAEELRLHFPDTPILVMGALTVDELEWPSQRRPRSRSGARASATCRSRRVRRARPADPGPRQARQRHGPARRARPRRADRARRRLPGRPRLDLAGVWTHFATADERGSDSFWPSSSTRFRARRRCASASSPRTAPCTPPTAPRSCATRAAHFDMVRCGIAVYGLDPFQRDPAERGPGAGARAALLRRRREALRARGQRRLRPDLAGAGGHLGRGAADRLRRRGAARPLQQRRGAGPRAGATRWSARSRWTTSPSTSAPRPTSSPATRRS